MAAGCGLLVLLVDGGLVAGMDIAARMAWVPKQEI